MDLTLFNLFNEEQKSMVALIKEFCQREIDSKALRELADKPVPPNATKEQLMARIPWDIISKAHDVGLRQLAVPKEYGGGGYGGIGGWLTLTILSEALGYWGGEGGRLLSIPWKHCAVLSRARKEIKEEFFPTFMKNRRTLVAGSISEPDHGSDLLLPYDEPGYSGKYFCKPDGEYWVINGEKMYCTGGGVSDYIILSLRTDKDGPITKSMSTFLFPTKTKGWSVRFNDMMGNGLAGNVQMRFDNCRIHKRLMISELNEAWPAMHADLAGNALPVMTRIGEAQKIWEDIRDYAKKRIQGSKPIIQHPNVGTLVAEGDVLLQTARFLIYKFVWECDRIEPGKLVNPLGYWYINYWCKVVIHRLISIGLEVYGGMGPQKELLFERWVRANLSQTHGGSTGILSLIKASHVL
jgi:alkylation response protein AidB-like acyl-CoA dehydrogenase